MKKTLMALLALILVMTMVGCSNNGNNEANQEGSEQGGEAGTRTLTVGTSADFPPFESVEIIDGKEQYVGFDIDLIHEIGKELGAEIVIENMDFNGLIAAVQTGKIDMAISGISADEKRAKNVNFSDPYYETAQNMVVKKDSPELATMEEVKGLIVGSQLGSTSDDVISKFEGVDVKKYNKVTDAIQDLKNGRINAVIVEDAIAQAFIQQNDDLEIVIPEGLNTEDKPFAIALPKEDDELVGEVNTALQNIKDSGKYDELIDKWMNTSVAQ